MDENPETIQKREENEQETMESDQDLGKEREEILKWRKPR